MAVSYVMPSLNGLPMTGGALEDADFTQADLTHSLLNGVRMDNAVFIEANLKETRFLNSVLDGTDFTNAQNLPMHLQDMLEQRKATQHTPRH